MASEGRNRAWVNGSPATATAVGTLGAQLVDIHGQHEHQSLLEPAAQRSILDIFAGAAEVAGKVGALHHQISEKRQALSEKAARVDELRSRADFLRFQLSEIDEAKLQEGEDAGLEAEAKRLDHAGELAMGAQGLFEALYGGKTPLPIRLRPSGIA